MISELLFHPDKTFPLNPDAFGLNPQDIYLAQDGRQDRNHSWYFATDQKDKVVLYLHGNAGNISYRLPKAKGFQERNISSFFLDYRGFGQSEGQIEHENEIFKDARDCYDYLTKDLGWKSDQIILWGESLGTAVATQLACEVDHYGLVLEAPFTSLPRILQDLVDADFPGVNEILFSNFNLNTEKIISNIKAPLCLIHGTQDDICPFSMGEKLYDLASQPKHFIKVEGGGHNDLPSDMGPSYWDEPLRILKEMNQ